ncbi:MAG: preprotein translocase subunit SecG [Robiginitomaculum sp.]|nr:preprotein translocase subunit SecG [Robiginitomaculum sp.]
MANVLLVILLIISVILIGLILIQRSEGGALGIGGGGGGGGGGLMSGRGTADMVQKMTAFFGAAFLLVSLLISISFNVQNKGKEEFSTTNAPAELSTSEKIQNNDLNAPVVSDKDTTPLVDDSQSGESDANPEEKPEEKPQD